MQKCEDDDAEKPADGGKTKIRERLIRGLVHACWKMSLRYTAQPAKLATYLAILPYCIANRVARRLVHQGHHIARSSAARRAMIVL
jgi:hypothetical protein